MPDILHLISTRACREEVSPTDLLDDLELDPIDLWGLRDDIERLINREIADDTMRKWVSVADILACVEVMA